jgi:hypothetical protein
MADDDELPEEEIPDYGDKAVVLAFHSDVLVEVVSEGHLPALLLQAKGPLPHNCLTKERLLLRQQKITIVIF